MSRPTSLPFTGEEDADRLLAEEPLALLIGMLLDQQVPMERAFVAPYRLRERLGSELDAATIAATDPDELAELFSQQPALHRFPGNMAKRTQALCQALVEQYDGDATAIWRDVDSGAELFKRLQGLPGFGKQKAQVLLALLAKQFGIAPEGWEERAGDYAPAGHRSVADIGSFDDVEKVRETKRQLKAEKKQGKS